MHLLAYIDGLTEAGLLKPEDATCVLYARVDDDRRALTGLLLDQFGTLAAELSRIADSAAAHGRSLDGVLVTPAGTFHSPRYHLRCTHCAHEDTTIAPTWMPSLMAHAIHDCPIMRLPYETGPPVEKKVK